MIYRQEGPPRLKRPKTDVPFDVPFARRKMKLPRRERYYHVLLPMDALLLIFFSPSPPPPSNSFSFSQLAEHYPLTASVMHWFRLCARKLDNVAFSSIYTPAAEDKVREGGGRERRKGGREREVEKKGDRKKNKERWRKRDHYIYTSHVMCSCCCCWRESGSWLKCLRGVRRWAT